jgi:hypothetical protein
MAIRFAWSVEHELQVLRDEVLELATPQSRLGLSPALKIIRNLDRRLHGAPPGCHNTLFTVQSGEAQVPAFGRIRNLTLVSTSAWLAAAARRTLTSLR